MASQLVCPAPALHLIGSQKPPQHGFPQQSPERQGKTGKRTVLVVDDERLIADTLVEILESSGFQAVAAYNGQSAMKALEENCPDYVVTDVIMPDVNGIEVAKYATDMCSSTRVLVLSGQAATADLLSAARKLGYTFELLPKPLRPETLIAKLRQ